MTTARALILAVASYFSKVPPPETLMSALINVYTDKKLEVSTEELALLITYGWHESRFQTNPKSYSWDAKARVSCGVWQEPCGFVEKATVEEQARWWIKVYRQVGLEKLDSCAWRAGRRRVEAAVALGKVEVM